MSSVAALERDRVGPYYLVKAIGAGGSARVDLARIERAYGFQRHVVIKRPLEHLRGDARAAESLRREARLGGRLRHPNLIAILDAGTHDGYDYIVLEYVHGGSLRDLMQTEEGPRVRDTSLDVALGIVRDIARGLHEAHELRDESGAPLGLVHRDVSPANVLIGSDGAVKLADFGIAKETRVATLSGSMHGTVTYMAPEQCRGHAFDRRADIFSLGVILYELVTGQRLFWADNDVASLHRVLAGHVPRPRKVKPSVAPVLEEIILKAVADDPEKRFATARELADALERYGSDAGQILAARSVARWVHELIGPRDVPWIGNATVIDAPLLPPTPDEEDIAESLVPIIEATPPPEDIPLATFGPSDAAVAEDLVVDTQPSLPAVKPRTSRALWAAMVGGCLALGVVVAIVLAREPKPAATKPPAAERVEMPVHQEQDEPILENANPGETGSDDEIEIEPPNGSNQPPAHHRKQHRKTTASAKPAPADAGSGSAAAVTKPPPKVEWDPTMLLPSDKKKQ